MIKEIVYKLKKPFEYLCEGQKVFAKSITIKSPNYYTRDELSILESEYYKVSLNSIELLAKIKKAEKSEGKKESSKKESKEDAGLGTYQMLAMGGADMPTCYKAFDAILLSQKGGFKNALVDGKEPITEHIITQIDARQDYNAILGLYVSDFLVESLGN